MGLGRLAWAEEQVETPEAKGRVFGSSRDFPFLYFHCSLFFTFLLLPVSPSLLFIFVDSGNSSPAISVCLRRRDAPALEIRVEGKSICRISKPSTWKPSGLQKYLIIHQNLIPCLCDLLPFFSSSTAAAFGFGFGAKVSLNSPHLCSSTLFMKYNTCICQDPQPIWSCTSLTLTLISPILIIGPSQHNRTFSYRTSICIAVSP